MAYSNKQYFDDKKHVMVLYMLERKNGKFVWFQCTDNIASNFKIIDLARRGKGGGESDFDNLDLMRGYFSENRMEGYISLAGRYYDGLIPVKSKLITG